MEYFGLELEESKSRLIEFGRFAERDRRNRGQGKPEIFDFLGFTHYCSKSRNGKFRVKRKTSKKKLTKKCKEVNRWLADMRTLPLQEIIKRVNSMLVGYFHYYGITDNSKAISDFKYIVRKLLFKWLNRRSQRRSYNWGQFNDMLRDYPLATPRTYVSIYE